ncbi:aminoglycoside phosphotransferase [Kribbella sp. CA-293567]|uniref:aminoglycoside phosphotransferase n=1 Tax=Kribbella sp. CA-293567 TaxID=3002436 RepID=UPI0022DD0CA7|nr:aminoglycoside phosphotransferase [Kribbella sp. CA-293567]WBQ03935.1 aminoglycoside phosphotransferase [Kribbella sp. CA-293567]
MSFSYDAARGAGRGRPATPLRHNLLNAVTAKVERVTGEDGNTFIRKELRRPCAAGVGGAGEVGLGGWAASEAPRHWNYWRREVEVYRDAGVRERLTGTGLGLPEGGVEEFSGGAVLWLEDVAGRPGTEFALADHAALALGCGRWQARPAPEREWTSTGFLRDYSTTRDVPWEVLDDDAAWRQPLVADSWPAGLRRAWAELVAHRGELLTIVEQSPRAQCHLDLWVSNVIRRPDGEIALLDWAFTGDGALGEDIGNHIPDAVFDLFWPAERIGELAETCLGSYLEGLREGGWRGEPAVVRRAVMASMVKYAWLLPLVLAKAANPSHAAYHQQVDSQRLFQQRGLAFEFVADWAAEALKGRR